LSAATFGFPKLTEDEQAVFDAIWPIIQKQADGNEASGQDLLADND
jgi:hypothetical protein